MKTARRVRWVAVLGLAVLSVMGALRDNAQATPDTHARVQPQPPCASSSAWHRC